MYRTILVILLGFLTVNLNRASVQVPQPDDDDIPLRGADNEKLDQIKLPKDQVALVRLPSNTLLKYTAYKDVSILHFRIPPDTRTALFTFKAYEESKSAFQRVCQPRDVTLHLKAGSYPVISPENITFPRNFLSADQRFKIYNLQFESNGRQQRLSVDGPQAGNWFAVAFISWTDPNNERIEQQGLAASCETLLLSEMSVSRILPTILQSGQIYNNTLTNSNTVVTSATNNSNSNNIGNITSSNRNKNTERTNSNNINSNNTKDSNSDDTTGTKNTTSTAATKDSEINSYKFYVPRNVGIVTARLIIDSICLKCPDLGFYVQANALPSDTNFIHNAIIKPNQTGEISFEFYVQSGTWHFIDIKFLKHKIETKPISTSSITTVSSSLSSSSSTLSPSTLSVTAPIEHASLKHNHFDTSNNNDNGNSVNFNFNKTSINENKPNTGWKNTENIKHYNTISSRTVQGIARNIQNLNDTLNNMSDNPVSYEINYSIQLNFHIENESQNDVNNKNNTQNHKTNPNKLPGKSIKFRNIEFYPLLRQTYREFFMFDYDLIPDENGTVPTVLNLTAGSPVGFRFEVGDVYDIGGTLSFGLSMKRLESGNKSNEEDNNKSNGNTNDDIKNGILAQKLVDRSLNNGEINNEDIELYPEGSQTENNNADDKSQSLSSTPRSNQTIIICMRLGEPGEPKWPDKCRYGGKSLPASGIINNTDAETSTGLIHVPFPESGQWYITVGLFCHGAETTARVTIIDSVKEFVKKYSKMLDNMKLPCSCAHFIEYYKKCIDDRKCFQQMNETETLKIKECLMDSKCTDDYIEMTKKFEIHHKFATEQSVATDSSCNTSLVFTISSSPCVAGRCGRYGRCYHYMSGGFVFSTCLCIKGYRGWDCTEDSQVPSSISILIASLLLTLSNLLFIPSIYFAVKRKYYTESVIYFFAMFFSIFYHACDSGEDEYSFCLVKINVLQFCDFYCGLLAIWVTLIAMAHIRQQFVSLLHMIGAIVLAFGTELNKQSLWVFLAPALTGLCLISVSWGMRCRKTRKWFPSRKYLTIYMPIGAVLVMIGLVCYAFLQTKQNYHIVHSVWHMVMALSLLCLLPSRNSFLPKC
ncbi:uncharacterized protein LOC129605811 [Condylostylus longicornis]|uniref:uncharacterized protein LOC129605811 n=1 Tax=Condylostylus longicornis TaxID=2530218 RepID=UPI00244E213F|nr:uncharacterized protein LOC129605811 [Condylostylus longicornis]XP_055371745.1 uncharacterized protein LOC129605811 [Condylostylus longicornis]XP_055371746.1 uncharacterized protein LOC129605811 [Condylostylus longicornis]